MDRVYHVGGGDVCEVKEKTAYLAQQSVKISDSCPTFAGADPLVSLRRVAFSVKDGRQILKGITFDVERGTRAVLLGENGCGKTTLMRLIARLQRPSGGEIIQNIDRKFTQKPRGSKAWYRKVGVVYQNPDYQLFMPTVEKEISFSAVSREYAEEVAEMFDVRRLFSRHPQSLSEGQKRRVSIAAIMASKPDLLLLDEPTVGQDYDGLCAMVDVLNRLHMATGNTMVTVTHDVRCAEALCDRTFLLSDGVVQKCGGKELVREYFR